MNESVEAKVVNEIERVTGGGEIDFSQAGELKYTKMVIQEAMRLHPPFWFENRSAIHDVELGGALIPKGSMIAFSRYALHRNARYWQDPETFNPSRFDEEASGTDDLMRSAAYTPFSSGPRVCIGRHFAMLEMIVILCKVLQRYKVQTSAHYEHKVATNLTMEPKGGLLVNLKPRE